MTSFRRTGRNHAYPAAAVKVHTESDCCLCSVQPVGVSPAAIEAAENDAEDGTSVAGDGGAAAAAAMGGDGGAAMGGDGGYGGLGSALFEPSPVDLPLDSGERRFD